LQQRRSGFQVGDLGAHAEMSMIRLVSGDDVLFRESLQRKVADLRRELSRPGASSLEALAASLKSRLLHLKVKEKDGLEEKSRKRASPWLTSRAECVASALAPAFEDAC
jgi:hypothetical protein